MYDINPKNEPSGESVADENRFRTFIGSKIIKARPMDRDTFFTEIKNQPYDESTENSHGYLVEYPDGYLSWSPKNVFENAYREILQSEKDLIV